MSMFSICKHTIQESYESGHRKSTDNVTEIYCDNATFYVKMSKKRAFGMFVAGNSVNALQVCSIAPVLLFITTRDGTTGQESLLTYFGLHDVRQRRQDRTVKLLSCNYASGSSRNF